MFQIFICGVVIGAAGAVIIIAAAAIMSLDLIQAWFTKAL